MTNSIYGIPNIKVKFFSTVLVGLGKQTHTENFEDEINEFLKIHEGDILDVQYQPIDREQGNPYISVMVVYTEKDKPGKKTKE